MSQNWPEEPWMIKHDFNVFTFDGSRAICSTGGYSNNVQNPDELYEELTSTARRIVACVNACKGISTEILEGIILINEPVPVQQIIKDMENLDETK